MLDRSSPSRFHFPSEMYHHHARHHHESTKRHVISPPPCRCCRNNKSSSPDDLTHRRSPVAADVPKLLRYDHQSPPSPTKPDLYHHTAETEEDERQRNVSVIKAHHEELPSPSPSSTLSTNIHHKPIRRTNSVSSVDQQSMDSHSERSFDSRSPNSPFSTQQHFPTTTGEQSPRIKHSKDIYRSHQQPHRERVRILQDVTDLHHLHEQRAVAMKSLNIREPHPHHHYHHHHQHRDDYHEIPSPNYPRHHHHHITFNPAALGRMDHGQNFAFSPYLEANLRHKFAGKYIF